MNTSRDTRKATPNYLKVTTHDTTLEALLTGKVQLTSFRDWPNVEPLKLEDPFQNAVPCWHLYSTTQLELERHASGRREFTQAVLKMREQSREVR